MGRTAFLLLCAVAVATAADAVEEAAEDAIDDAVSFYEQPINERRILLVLDHSRSMLSQVDGQTRLTRLRAEVQTFLGRLNDAHYIDVHCFNDRLATWRRKLEPATERNVKSATAFILRQPARGRTATYDALQSALVEAADQAVERIIFVTDGHPTVGTVIDPAEILERLRLQNAPLGVPIDVLAYDTSHHPARDRFLRTLAGDHRGRYVQLD